MIRFSLLVIVLMALNGFSQPFNNVALLSGQDDFIEIPDNFGTGFTNEITIEAWVKPCQINGHRMILTKFYCISNNNQFYFTILDGKLRWAWDNTGCADGANFYETGVVVQQNIWQHIAVRHTTTGVTLFLNGAPVPGTLIQGAYGNMLFSNEPLRIGVYKTITSNWFGSYNGLMDEVRIWDYAVSDNDIANRYQAPLLGNELGLVGYYDMDITGSGTGVVVPNSATNAPTGTDGVTIGTTNSPAFVNSTNSLSNQLFGADTLICVGETILLDATGFTGDYVWQDGTTDSLFLVTQPGLYFVSITNSCEVFSDSIQVGFEPPPVFNLGNDTLLCQGENLELSIDNVADATGYLWQDGSVDSTFMASQGGTYSVTVFVDGCQATDSIEVNYSTLFLNLGPDSILCEDEFLFFDLTQTGASYLWQNGFPGSEYYILDSGLYSVTVSDASCQLTDSIYVDVNKVEADFIFDTSPKCGSSPVNYDNQSSINFGYIANLEWSLEGGQIFSGSPNPTQMVSISTTQKVKLKVTTNHGCVDEKTLFVPVEVYDEPNVNFIASDFKPSAGESVKFENTSEGNHSYLWTIEETYTTDSVAPSYVFETEGIFKVGLQAYNDLCSSFVYKYIVVEPPLYYYIPNAFTPNDNSKNDTFSPIFTSGFSPIDFQLTIYNRWGEILFLSRDASVGWNGLYGGKHVQAGAYIWKIEFLKSEARETITDYGTITVFY